MRDIYQAALDEKFAAIMLSIARDLGYGDDLKGLIVQRRDDVIAKAEQAILVWATERQRRGRRLTPITILQQLLDQYCAIAEHL